MQSMPIVGAYKKPDTMDCKITIFILLSMLIQSNKGAQTSCARCYSSLGIKINKMCQILTQILCCSLFRIFLTTLKGIKNLPTKWAAIQLNIHSLYQFSVIIGIWHCTFPIISR